MQHVRAGLLAIFASAAVLVTAGSAHAQECVVGGTPVQGELCPSGSPTPSPSPTPTRTRTASPTPTPTQTRTATPRPEPTGSLVIVPSPVPFTTPSQIPGTFGPAPEVRPTTPGYIPLDNGMSATGPGLPVVPGDGRGFTAMVLGMLGAGGAGAFALARARVRAWMVGI